MTYLDVQHAYVVLACLAAALALYRATKRRSFWKKYRRTVTPRNRSWQGTRRLTFALSLGRDCVCPLLPEVDHLHYRNLGVEVRESTSYRCIRERARL